ncbi:MAG TPA: PfkB family carbohydrate kinase [Longimicrobium sp.]
MKRLGILGTFVWDTCWTLADQAAGRAFESWGGMAYSLASAAATRPEGWEIVPIAHVGADLLGRAHAYLDTLGGVGPRTAVVPVDQPNNRVELVYTDEHNRGEQMRGGVRGWTWDELAPHVAGLDALLVNFFSGWEMDLASAERLARCFPGPVYADFHSLFLGPPRDGPRLPRRLPDWERWLGCFDVVQMNEEERALIAPPPSPTDPPAELLAYGPDAALVTLGPRGAAFAARGGDEARPGLRGERRITAAGAGHVPAHHRVTSGDPTGSGDVWGAAAWCGLLGGLGLRAAVERANAAAVVKMEHRGATALYEHLVARREAWA